MPNRIFVYYCALCGGGAAFLAWAIMAVTGLAIVESDLLHSMLVGAILGIAVVGALASVDSILNAPPGHRLTRVLGAAAFGLLGGLMAGMLCDLLTKITPWLRFIGWLIVGVAIGAAIHVYDLIQSLLSGKPLGLAKQKLTKGMIAGALGGGTGGLLFSLLDLIQVRDSLPRTSLVLALVILGMGVGLFAGFAQLVLKEAWIKVEAGFRPGREMVLDKNELTIGRAESCDLGLFGDSSIDGVHARIERQGESYFLADAGSEGGTFLNNRRVTQATKLHAGDLIRVGGSVLMFGERVKVPTSRSRNGR
jgi:FHA domain